jgi:hypothetical protein
MPLIGAQGPGSNISWRGNLDEYPDFFEFPQVLDSEIGIAVTSQSQTITGINYKALVTAVGSGASVSVNGGSYINGNDPNNPIIIRNSDVIRLQIRTTDTNTRFDFNKTYNVDVTVGKRSASWLVRSKALDDTPEPFAFTNSLNNEVSIARTSNEVVVQGIDADLGVDVLVTSPTGVLFINGVNSGRAAKIVNNDRLYLQNTTSGFYDTNVDTTIVLGTFTTSWSLKTRVADKTVNAFVLGSVTNVGINTILISNTITLSGADPNVNGNNPLEASILGANGEFRVVRDGVEVRGYSPNPFTVQNGDQITVKAVASQNFATTIAATLTVSGVSDSYSITTRPTPIKTFPSQFTFVDRTGVERTNTLTPPENRIDSAPITLTGMSTAAADFGTATITGNGGDGSAAQFRVVRGGVTVRDFGSASFQVRNGDQITLRIISSPNSLGSVQAVFTINGINTTDVLAGVAGSTSDTWVVTSAQRFCNITAFTLPQETNANPDQTYSRTFVASGFDKDCNCTVTTSDTTNSFLKIGNVTGTSLSVKLGDTVEVFLTCPYFDSTRTTTVTLTSSFGTTRNATFTVIPKAPPLPVVTLDANPRNSPFVFPVGGSTVLTYSYDFVTNPAVVTNFGVTTVTTPKSAGIGATISNILTTTTYSITVSNSTGSTTATVQVTVGTPPTPTISLCTGDTATCSSVTNRPFGSPVTLFWKSTFGTSITSPDFSTGNLQNGSVTFPSLTQDNKTYTVTVTGPGGTVSATQTINLTPTVTLTVTPSTIINGSTSGATLSWRSNLATRVVSSNGFSAFGATNGDIPVNPTVTTDYSITVADDEGLTGNANARLTVQDDIIVDDFFFNPASFTEQETGAIVTSTPLFGFGQGSVTGLSPGVTVTATVSGAGARFSDGSTSKQVQNGTSTSLLAVSLTNSSTRNEQRTATLTIGSKSASFTSRTKACTPVNSTASIDNAITILTRQSNNASIFIGYGIEGGFGVVPRTVATSGEQIFSSPGPFTFTPPAGITRVRVEAIGGGGGGCSGRDSSVSLSFGVAGGGGGATSTEVNVSGSFSGTVGGGGAGFLLGNSPQQPTSTSTPVDFQATITTNTCSVSVSGDSGGYIQNATAQNCGVSNCTGTQTSGCIPSGCSNTTSRRYYSVAVRNLTSPSIDFVSNSSVTAGGLDTSRDGDIFFSGSSGSGSSRNFWFCRGNAGGGTTHVRSFVIRVRGTITTTTPGVNGPNSFGGDNGGTTTVRQNTTTILTATGGRGGSWNGTTSSSRVPGAGGSPGGGTATASGGGGSGKVNGGTNSAGTSRAGGTGEGFGGTTNSGGSAAGSQGGSGGQYGGGGGPGNTAGGSGGNGSSGAVRFSWTAPAAQTFTYNQVVTQIFSAFWSKGNRGPQASEVQTWINNFKNNPTTYPDLSSLFNAITVPNIGITIPPVDNCGDAIPRFP